MGRDSALNAELTPGWNALAPRVFRPAERSVPLSDEVSALDLLDRLDDEAKASVSPAAVAWARHAPAAWRSDERRLFVCETHRDNARVDVPTLWSATGQRALRREPTAIATVLTLCADPVNVEAAEELAREASRRMAPWGATDFRKRDWSATDHVLWLVEDNAWIREWSQLLHFRSEARQKLQPMRFEHTNPPNSGDRTRDWRWKVEDIARWDLHCEALWKEKRPAEPNPFEPIVAIWRLGYALADVHREGIILVANAPSVHELVRVLA